MLLWGIMMVRPNVSKGHFVALNNVHQTIQGLVHNYGGLLGMRWMLGT